MCVSSEGVGLDGSATDNDALDVAGVGLTSATWGACGLSMKVRGEKGMGEGRSRLSDWTSGWWGWGCFRLG